MELTQVRVVAWVVF